MSDEQASGDAMTSDDLANRLGAIATALEEATTGPARQDLWRQAGKALSDAGADPGQVDRATGRRSVVALSRFVEDVRTRGFDATRGAAPVAATTSTHARRTRPVRSTPPAATPAAVPSADELKKAMRAFRKRLKLTRLNDESKLGRSPMTSGKQSDVVAIMPPHGFRPAIWETLVAQGKLRHTGRGFYEIV